MKWLLIIVRPHVVPKFVESLKKLPTVELVCVEEVKGYGRQKSYLNEYQGSEYSEAYIPKIMVEIRVEDQHLELAISRITEMLRTGRMGDGKIFVFDVCSL